MIQLSIQKKADGYWLIVEGKIKAMINIVSSSPLVLKALEEATEPDKPVSIEEELTRM